VVVIIFGTWLGTLWHSELGTGDLRGAISTDTDLFVLSDSCYSDMFGGLRMRSTCLSCRVVLSVDPHFVDKGFVFLSNSEVITVGEEAMRQNNRIYGYWKRYYQTARCHNPEDALL
jgi:hypothetical protein